MTHPLAPPDPSAPPDIPAASDRRVGVEIEFAGLDEAQVARIVQATLGGSIAEPEPFMRHLTGTVLGSVRVELDTAWRRELSHAPTALDTLAHTLIPVEIVTDPIGPKDFAQLDALAAALRDAGAQGTRAALTHGFGVHFNPELTDLSLEAILPVVQAFALLEPWLRHHEPMTLARRALPFTAPWPQKLRRSLLCAPPDDLDGLVAQYLDQIGSRNYGLDLLPLLRHIRPDMIEARLGAEAPSARPTYHFRLPSCRIDEPGWTVSAEWLKWQAVEQLAGAPALLAQVRSAWLSRSDPWLRGDDDWVAALDGLLQDSTVTEPQA